MFRRKNYLEKIRPFFGKQLIKVLAGQRRVGKSYLLLLISEELKKADPEATQIFIDKEKYEFDEIQNYHDLIRYVDARHNNEKTVLLIDEVQEIEEFEKALRHLLSLGNIDIYCTGSNSRILSGELATLLSGRQVIFQVHALSYPEYLQFHHQKAGEESLNDYLRYGGLPYLIHLPKKINVREDYLKNIYTTILYRDIISRYQIRDIPFFENLVKFLADNTGSLLSAQKISSYLKSQRIKKSVSVIIDYISYLQQAFFIYPTKRMEVQGKRIFESGEKVYFEDLGLRNAIIGYRPSDINKLLENAVFHHLVYYDYEVYVGWDGNHEIDFLAERGNERIYLQVTYLLSSDEVVEREFGNLLRIKDQYPKYVISMDNTFPNTHQGIRHLSLLDFLQSEI